MDPSHDDMYFADILQCFNAGMQGSWNPSILFKSCYTKHCLDEYSAPCHAGSDSVGRIT